MLKERIFRGDYDSELIDLQTKVELSIIGQGDVSLVSGALSGSNIS